VSGLGLAVVFWPRRGLMRITLVIPSLYGGGAERVATNMANHWARKGWNITLLTLLQGSVSPSYDLHAEVTHRDLRHCSRASNPSSELTSFKGWWEIFKASSPIEQVVLLSNLRPVATLRQAIMNAHPQAVISLYGSGQSPGSVSHSRAQPAGHCIRTL
jgi:hypothetical protein